MIEFWIFLAYFVGTLFGLVIGIQTGFQSGADRLLATLVAGGYLNYNKTNDGNIHIKKLGE